MEKSQKGASEPPGVTEIRERPSSDDVEEIWYRDLLKPQDEYWQAVVLADPHRALCLETACRRLSLSGAQDLVVRLRLRLLHEPPFGHGLDGFNRLVHDELDAQEKRHTERLARAKRSVPPKPDHLAA